MSSGSTRPPLPSSSSSPIARGGRKEDNEPSSSPSSPSSSSGHPAWPAEIPRGPPPLEFHEEFPVLHELFQQYDLEHFWGTLGSVEVRWSPRMTLCAGLCVFQRGGYCSIRLSEALLKFRPVKDFRETLLHEMIHAYLFLTQRDRDRDGHGPNFCSHMNRINSSTGLNITIYHSFHDEVQFYRKHVWRCTGPCRDAAPYYGYVRRAMNRAPASTDPWWAAHAAKCNGRYEKISEPPPKEKGSRGAAKGKAKASSSQNSKTSIKKYLTSASSSTSSSSSTTKIVNGIIERESKKGSDGEGDDAAWRALLAEVAIQSKGDTAASSSSTRLPVSDVERPRDYGNRGPSNCVGAEGRRREPSGCEELVLVISDDDDDGEGDTDDKTHVQTAIAGNIDRVLGDQRYCAGGTSIHIDNTCRGGRGKRPFSSISSSRREGSVADNEKLSNSTEKKRKFSVSDVSGTHTADVRQGSQSIPKSNGSKVIATPAVTRIDNSLPSGISVATGATLSTGTTTGTARLPQGDAGGIEQKELVGDGIPADNVAVESQRKCPKCGHADFSDDRQFRCHVQCCIRTRNF